MPGARRRCRRTFSIAFQGAGRFVVLMLKTTFAPGMTAPVGLHRPEIEMRSAAPQREASRRLPRRSKTAAERLYLSSAIESFHEIATKLLPATIALQTSNSDDSNRSTGGAKSPWNSLQCRFSAIACSSDSWPAPRGEL